MLLEARDVQVRFPVRSRLTRQVVGELSAVAGVSIDVDEGGVLALVGESGSGKTTFARTVAGLQQVTSGEIRYRGQLLTGPGSKDRWRAVRREIQFVFQDPYSSLNPHRTARQIVYEGLEVQRAGLTRRELRNTAASLLETVGISPDYADRYPHEFSGGERQRIGIARALALHPRLLICDEPVSSLDVSVQAQLLNLFRELRSKNGLAYLFISHDLGVVQHVADTVAVMYLGKVVEQGPLEDVFARPRHPYSLALSSATPQLRPWRGHHPGRVAMHADLPSPLRPPSGCRFRTRCWKATELCASTEPVLAAAGTDQQVACHYPLAPSTTTSPGQVLEQAATVQEHE